MCGPETPFERLLTVCNFVEISPKHPPTSEKLRGKPFRLVEKFEEEWQLQDDKRGRAHRELLCHCARWVVLCLHWLSKDNRAFYTEIVDCARKGSENPTDEEILEKFRTVLPLARTCLKDIILCFQDAFVHRREYRQRRGIKNQ